MHPRRKEKNTGEQQGGLLSTMKGCHAIKKINRGKRLLLSAAPEAQRRHD